jgi:hypothetical protein
MIGPFATAPRGLTHVLVAIDKFTKWIEFKPITKLTPDRVVDFISDILHRFGFPNTIIIDLGSNFTANQFWEFCENSSIKVKYVSVAHPRANGQVERANDLIIDGLKKILYDTNTKKGGKWIHELPHVIWGLRTQPSKAIGQTPFFLIYGSEAILPIDIMWKSPRVEMYKEGEADEARQLELDSVEEARCSALVQSARYLQGIQRYHDRNIKERSFSIGDLVLRRVQDESGLHKLNSRWEGPFIVKRVKDQDFIDYNTLTVKMYPIHGIYNTCDVSTLKGICPQFLYAPRLFSFSGSIWRLFVPHDPKGNFSNTLRRLWPHPYYSNRLLATRICVIVMTIMSFPDSLCSTCSSFI